MDIPYFIYQPCTPLRNYLLLNFCDNTPSWTSSTSVFFPASSKGFSSKFSSLNCLVFTFYRLSLGEFIKIYGINCHQLVDDCQNDTQDPHAIL